MKNVKIMVLNKLLLLYIFILYKTYLTWLITFIDLELDMLYS